MHHIELIVLSCNERIYVSTIFFVISFSTCQFQIELVLDLIFYDFCTLPSNICIEICMYV